MVKTCQSLIGIETCMHLTCTNMPKEKVDIALKVRMIMNWHAAPAELIHFNALVGGQGTWMSERACSSW